MSYTNEEYDAVRPIVKDINRLERGYGGGGADGLRVAMEEAEKAISRAKDTTRILEAWLPQVFALMKRYARLLCAGPVVVRANSHDVKLASECDFVTVENNRAIYSNHWLVAGREYRWDMVHYDEQIAAGVLLHRGMAVQMATGEGKTLAATLPVCLNALAHRGVHVMTANNYLSRRDYEMTRPLYAFFGLDAACLEMEEQASSWAQRNQAYGTDVTFGQNSSFVFDYLYDHLTARAHEIRQSRPQNYALIDELDEILIDDAATPHIISGGQLRDGGELYEKYKPEFERMFNSLGESLYTIDSAHRQARYTDLGRERIPEDPPIRTVFQRLLEGYTLYQKDVDYIVAGEKIKIIDPNTGRVKDRNRWEHGLHTAIEVKEGLKPCPDYDGMAVISLKNYYRLYCKVAGMSGTITEVADELAEVYGLRCAVVPTHRPTARADLPMRIYATTEAKRNAVCGEIERLHSQGRPILVGSTNMRESECYCKMLDAAQLDYNRLDAKTLQGEATVIAGAGRKGTITLATSVGGRGTDIKLDTCSRAIGGLAVIATEMFPSKRVDRQLQGRAGRQGDPGTAVAFVSLDDAILKHLPEEDQIYLHTAKLDEDIRPLFIKAQALCETYNRQLRAACQCKDDIIDPFRKDFYTWRDKMLRCAYPISDAVNKVLENADDVQLWERRGQNLYADAVKLARMMTRTGSVGSVCIPYSTGDLSFAVRFDVERLLKSENYFARQYALQVLLSSADRYWKVFVLHVLSELNNQELGQLPEYLANLQEECNRDTRKCLLRSHIPVGCVTHSARQEPKIAQTDNHRHRGMVLSSAPCPCGSGKSFGQCHGRNLMSPRR